MVPTSYVKFMAFLRKNLGDFRAFIDIIWSRVKHDSQYQLEEAQDWASHFEHLESILLEFGADGAPKESDLIRFFREGLKTLIKAQMEQRGRELDSREELVEKAVDVEAKAGLQPTAFVIEIDQRCPRGNCLAHTTVAKFPTQGSSFWDLKLEEPSGKSAKT